MKALYGFHRELTSCLLCAIVGVGAGRQVVRDSLLYALVRAEAGGHELVALKPRGKI
jgi:hypothetical protein